MSDSKSPKSFDSRKEVDIPLFESVTVDAVKYSSLKMRRPKGKDSLKMAGHRGNDTAKSFLLLADLCGVSPDVIEELDAVDLQALNAQVEAFTGGQAG